MRSDGVHSCPVGDCVARVPRGRLMCPAHWQLVPAKLKRALHRASRNGNGAGSRAHRAAAHACIEAAETRHRRSCQHSMRRTARRFLAAYTHPNRIDGEMWDEEDTALRVLRCQAHKPDPRTSRCLHCGATLAT
jgi:hypothetical protein